MTFPLERDKDGRLIIHVVKGNRSYAYGERPTTSEIRDDQVKPAMRAKDIDIDQEHIILFQNLTFVSEKDGDTVLHSWAPYCGGGTHRSGTAWVIDFPFLDPLNLPKKSPRVLDDGNAGDRPEERRNHDERETGGGIARRHSKRTDGQNTHSTVFRRDHCRIELPGEARKISASKFIIFLPTISLRKHI